MTADGVQMVADKSPPPVDDPRVEKLGQGDAADMLDLATLTRPGFRQRSRMHVVVAERQA